MCPKWQLMDFINVLVDCELYNLGYSRIQFTQSNRRDGDELICKQLDKYVRNKAWCNLFPRGRVIHSSVAYSDHLPMILNTDGGALNHSNGSKPFRFESMWIGNAKCNEIIKDSSPPYNASVQDQNIMDYVQRCLERLRNWNKKKFGHVQTNLRKAQVHLQKLQDLESTIQNRDHLNGAHLEVQ